MHRIAENGVASHWLYKNSIGDFDALHLKTRQWLHSLMETLSSSADSSEFLEHLKIDLFPSDVFVFTPQGKILTLPRGSTAVDFAYAVHSDVGNCCVAAKINGENAPLRTKLKSGDRIEIVTAPYAKPNPSWLGYVATARARSHIRYFLKTIQSEESIKLGERMLSQALISFNINPNSITTAQWDKLARDSGVKSKQELFTEMALGKQLPAVVARRLTTSAESISKELTATPIIILGTEGLAVQFAKCCHPIPGDAIVGIIKKDSGLIVHVLNCNNISHSAKNQENYLNVAWGKDIARTFEAAIKIVTVNQQGVLARIAAEIAKADSNIDDIDMKNEHDYMHMRFILQVNNRLHLAQVIRGLRRLQGIASISRIED